MQYIPAKIPLKGIIAEWARIKLPNSPGSFVLFDRPVLVFGRSFKSCFQPGIAGILRPFFQLTFDDDEELSVHPGLKDVASLAKASFKTAVMKEQRVELAFENQRWFDLRRTMTPAELAAFMNAYGLRERANPTVSRGGISFTAQDYMYSEN